MVQVYFILFYLFFISFRFMLNYQVWQTATSVSVISWFYLLSLLNVLSYYLLFLLDFIMVN